MTPKQLDCLMDIKTYMEIANCETLQFDAKSGLALRHKLPEDKFYTAKTVFSLINKGFLEIVSQYETTPRPLKRNPFTREWCFTKSRRLITFKLNWLK